MKKTIKVIPDYPLMLPELDDIQRMELNDALEVSIKELCKRERTVITKHFLEGKTWKATGKDLVNMTTLSKGVSTQRAIDIAARALRHIRFKMRIYGYQI